MKLAVSVLDCADKVGGIKALNNTDIDYIHIDVMDGNFVPRVSFDKVEEIVEISNLSKYPLDVHLMVDNPSLYIRKLDNLNIRYITFHVEIEDNIKKTIELIRGVGYKVGVSIKPNTDINMLEPFLEDIDLILVMSVEPGMGGQKFLSQSIDRIRKVKEMIIDINKDIMIEVDGGINDEIIKSLVDVDIAVVGSYITKSNDYKEQVNKLLGK